jgi:hypothetical protein
MGSSPVFFDCPAYLDATGSARCGLPAEVEDEYTMQSTDGLLAAVRIRCPHGHYFNGPADMLAGHLRRDTWTRDGNAPWAWVRSLASP